MLARFKKSARMLKDPRTLAVTGVLMALYIVLGLFRIQLTQQLRLSISFVAGASIAMLFGPAVAVPAAAACDVLTLLVNPSGAYFWGFTVTAIVNALVYSSLLFDRRAPMHDRERTMGHGRAFFDREDRNLFFRALISRGVIDLLCNTFLNTLWLSMLYGDSMGALLPARAVKNAALFIPEAIILFFALKAVNLAWSQIRR